MTISEVILLFFTLLMLVPTIASMSKFDQWWIRGFDFPRIQICFLTILTIIAAAVILTFQSSWHYGVIAILLLSLFYQFTKIYPYTWLAKKQVKKHTDGSPDNSISILVSNVLTPNKRSDKLLALVKKRNPDILLTLETDKRWEDELSVLEEDYKYTVKVPQDNLYGMHLYSKLELIDTKVKFLVQDDIPSIHGCVILKNGKKIKFHCLHPMPPSPTESATSTNRDAELLLLGKHLEKENSGVLTFGDLNDVAWSRTTKLFQKMSGLLDPRIGRGFFNTFHAEFSLLRWPLDHVFHTKDFTLIEIAREENIGSDHFPMYIHLNYTPNLMGEQSELSENSEEEEKWAEEKIEKGQPLETSI